MAYLKISKKKPASRRTHSFGACTTCRKRHAKCDQARPTCRTCKVAGVSCEGWSSKIHWMSSLTTDADREIEETRSGPNARHHLYTEKQREAMSSALVTGLASSSVDQYLTEVDTQSQGLSTQHETEFSIGPFSVLNLNEESFSFLPKHTQLCPDSLTSLPVSDDPQPTLDIAAPELSTAEEFLGDLDNFLQWADIFNLDLPPVGWSLTPPASGHDEDHLADWASSVEPRCLPPEPQHLSLHQDQSLLLSSAQTPDIIAEAPRLLKHFRQHIVARITWLPMSQKSPWEILNIPSAMITLDQLTYMNETSIKHANLANLLGIIACSACHLSKGPEFFPDQPSHYWKSLFGVAYRGAKDHMCKSLESEFQGTGKAKYKEQVMALLSLTTCAIFSQNQIDARCHIINTEYLIRLRGLVKPRISRRARLLHHLYTWIRILTESTLVIHDELPCYAPCKALWSRRLDMEEMNRLAQRGAAIPPHNRSRGIDDFLCIAPADSNSDLNIDDPKDTQANLGDNHLVDSRQFPEELHTVINGVSQTWLGLLSQTTRLANVICQINAGKCIVAPARQQALHRRSQCLEDMICAFTSRKVPSPDGNLKAHMLRALNSALVIYFYRRVRQVNPCILQGHVKQIMDELREWDSALAQNDLVGPGTAWPAFMAGCEATGAEAREGIEEWLDRAASRSGCDSYVAAKPSCNSFGGEGMIAVQFLS